jgi:hypothetical protein
MAAAAETGEFDPACSVALDQDPEAVYFLVRDMDGVGRAGQRTAEQSVTRTLRPRRGRAGEGVSPPWLPLTIFWLLLPNQSRSTLGRVLGEMKISTAKNWQETGDAIIAGQIPCNAVLYKWGETPSPACMTGSAKLACARGYTHIEII